jgi:molybdate transport system ATP-binding protein
MSDTILSIRNLIIRRGYFILNDVSLDIHERELFAVIGKTGAGKTMLLEASAGFCKPDHGQVLYRGTPVRDIPLHKRNIGYLYQDYNLFPHMTAAGNIGYSLKMRHVPNSEIQSMVQEIARLFEVDGVLDQYPGTLSGGETAAGGTCTCVAHEASASVAG